MSRSPARRFSDLCRAAGLGAALAVTPPAPAADDLMTVYKSPTCGCCSAWVDYMREEGFEVESHDVTDLNAVKHRHGLDDPRLASCHTAIIGGYVIEGHVPADDVRRLLRERPALTGLTAPGMPMLSPGMNSREPRDYDVIGFDGGGATVLFSRY